MINLYTHQDLEGFHQALDKNLEDWATRLVLSDWFEEHGDCKTAGAIRWQVARKRAPFPSCAAPQHAWILHHTNGDTTKHRRATLPKHVFLLVQYVDYLTPNPVDWKYLPTRRAAEEALWRAWSQWHGARRYLARA